MTGYTKLFGSLVASSIWGEASATKVVWITMLAMANRDGVVEASVPGLATLSRESRADTETALRLLESPDPDSRSKEHEGRRIQKVDGGWLILNHAKYRAKLNAEERKEYNKLKQREWRANHKPSMTVNDKYALSAHTEAEAKAKAGGTAGPGLLVPIKSTKELLAEANSELANLPPINKALCPDQELRDYSTRVAKLKQNIKVLKHHLRDLNIQCSGVNLEASVSEPAKVPR